MNKREQGKFGEDLAREFLLEKGYRFVCSNYYSRFGEIDLVMWDRNVLVFCEVKFRRSLCFGGPLESVTYSKKMRMWKTAQIYLKEKNLGFVQWRFDVVGILRNKTNKLPVDNGPDQWVVKNEITHVMTAF